MRLPGWVRSWSRPRHHSSLLHAPSFLLSLFSFSLLSSSFEISRLFHNGHIIAFSNKLLFFPSYVIFTETSVPALQFSSDRQSLDIIIYFKNRTLNLGVYHTYLIESLYLKTIITSTILDSSFPCLSNPAARNVSAKNCCTPASARVYRRIPGTDVRCDWGTTVAFFSQTTSDFGWGS